MNQKLTREQLEALMGDRQKETQGKGLIQAWRHWRLQGERLVERLFHQKELPSLFQVLLNTYRQQALFPSEDNSEKFLNAKADLRGHLFEHVWRSSFRRYWKEEGRLIFTQMSAQAVKKWPSDRQEGSYLRLMGLLEAHTTPTGVTSEDVWYSPTSGELLKEEVAGVPFELWIMRREAPTSLTKEKLLQEKTITSSMDKSSESAQSNEPAPTPSKPKNLKEALRSSKA